MNGERATQIATAIRFKEYLLTRDVSSRKVIIESFIQWILHRGGMPGLLLWFQQLQAINGQIDAKDRKEQMKADACWDELLLEHSQDNDFLTMVRWFLNA